MNTQIKKLHPNAQIPTKGTPSSAGFDVYCIETKTITSKCQEVFNTGIAMKIPEGLYVRVAPRSGLAFRNQLNVHAGVIDSDFTDEIKVMLFNHSNADVTLEAGTRIAQLIFEKYEPTINFVETDELVLTERCDGVTYGGLGSTGL